MPKRAAAVAEQHGHGVRARVRDREVAVAVAIEVRARDRPRRDARRVAGRRRRSPRRRRQAGSTRCPSPSSRPRGRGRRRGRSPRSSTDRGRGRSRVGGGGEAPVAVAQQYGHLVRARVRDGEIGAPSPSKSALATADGCEPVAKSVFAAKPPSPSPSRTETLAEPALATTMSRSPSPVEVGARDSGRQRPGREVRAAPSDPPDARGVVLSSTETLLPLTFATARSRSPSSSKSALVTANGVAPGREVGLRAEAPRAVAEQDRHGARDRVGDRQVAVAVAVDVRAGHRVRECPGGEVGRAAKLPSPTPRSTVTLPEPAFAMARSGLPSPSKSALVTDFGLAPVAKSVLAREVARAVAEQHRHAARVAVGDGEVGVAVAVEVGACHRGGARPGGEIDDVGQARRARRRAARHRSRAGLPPRRRRGGRRRRRRRW